MPDNDKIQLPKGFKLDELDESIETPNVKLPKGFTLDTEVVKKKLVAKNLPLQNHNWLYQTLRKVRLLLKRVF